MRERVVAIPDERPVILAGHGVLIAEATDDLSTFAHKAQIPVTHTLLGGSSRSFC